MFEPAVIEFDHDPVCPDCGDYLIWEDCGDCAGEGWIDLYEDDPMWYAPGDSEPCGSCGMQGGGWYCDRCEAVKEPAA